MPGALAVAFYVFAILIVTARRPEIAPPTARLGWGARLRGLADAGAVIAIFLLVIGGIYGGVFTPTEAASVGAFLTGGVFIATQGLDLAGLREALLETAGTTAMIFLIVIGAGLFSFFLSFSGLPRVFAGAVTGLGLPPLAILLAIVVLYLVLGCFMDSLGMMILTVPVLFPLVQDLAPAFGMSAGEAAIWFGVIVVIAIEIGLMTPPLGLNVFIIQGVAPDIPVLSIFRGVVPFWVADVLRLVILILFPTLVLWFPRWLQ